MIKLRDYQKDGVDAILKHFKSGKVKDIPIIVAPTGSGKSIYIANVANELKGGVLVLQPTKEILEQNYNKYLLYGGKASIYSASVGIKEIGDVTFAMIGSVKKIAGDFAHVKCVIIDECHLVPPSKSSMFMGFLNNLKSVSKKIKVIGLTATPFRLKKYTDPFTHQPYTMISMLTRTRPKSFNKFLFITQISELYEKKFLCPIKYIEMVWSNGDLKVNSTGAEYTDTSMDESLKKQLVHERIPDMIKQSIEKGRKHRIVFVKNVTDAIFLSQKIPDSACVHAETKKKERTRILDDFRAGKIKTVFNVGVLTIGFDFPALDTIIVARPTMSLALFMQMVGRGIRLHPGKNDCAVVDMCGNLERFGKIENIKYLEVPGRGWIIHNGKRQLSGVPLNRK